MPAQQSSDHDRLRLEMVGEGERAAHRVNALAGEFLRAGHEVFVRGRGTPFSGSSTSAAATASTADVVHVHGWDAVEALGMPGSVAAVASLGPPDPDVGPATIALGQAYDRVIAPSTQAARELLTLGFRWKRLGVVPDGVDTDRYTAGPQGLGLHSDRSTSRILCVRQALTPDLLLDVMLALRRVPEARLFVAGGTAPERIRNSSEAHAIAAVAQRIGVASRVLLLGGVPAERMPDLYRSAHVVICTSEPDAPAVALQAMACAVPVIAYADGALTDIITHRVSGVLVERGNTRALGEAARAVLASEPRRYAYAVAGRSRVQERFTWPRVAEQIEAIYRSAIADRQVRPAVADR